jgi:hypothetical protein
MTPETTRQLESLISNRKAMLAELATWSEEALMFKPENAWNALQVVDHIINSEKGTLGYMMKKTKAPASELPSLEEASTVAAEKLNDALKSDSRWKAPAILPDPSDERSLSEHAAYWGGLQQKIQQFSEALDVSYKGKLIFKHPYAGRIDLGQTVAFLANHIEHHMHQIYRIKSDLPS